MTTKTNKTSSLKAEPMTQEIPYKGTIDGVSIQMNVKRKEGEEPESVNLQATKTNESGQVIFGITGSYLKSSRNLSISCYNLSNITDAPIDVMAKLLQEMIMMVQSEVPTAQN